MIRTIGFVRRSVLPVVAYLCLLPATAFAEGGLDTGDTT